MGVCLMTPCQQGLSSGAVFHGGAWSWSYEALIYETIASALQRRIGIKESTVVHIEGVQSHGRLCEARCLSKVQQAIRPIGGGTSAQKNNNIHDSFSLQKGCAPLPT